MRVPAEDARRPDYVRDCPYIGSGAHLLSPLLTQQEETVRTFALPDDDVEFARDLADRVRWTRENEDKFPPLKWQPVERLAVALVMDKRDYIETQWPDYPGSKLSRTYDFVCSGRLCSCEDRVAWLHKIRDAVEYFIEETPSDMD
jgi:hypothetical protein